MLLTGTRAAFLGLAAGAVMWVHANGEGPVAWIPGRRTVAIAAAALLRLIGFYFSPAGLLMRSRTLVCRSPWGGVRCSGATVSEWASPDRWPDGPETSAPFSPTTNRPPGPRVPGFAHESPTFFWTPW